MKNSRTLQSGLAEWAGSDSFKEAVAATLMAVVQGCASTSGLMSSGSVWRGRVKAPEASARLEQEATDLMLDALQMAPVRHLVTQDRAEHKVLKPEAPLDVALLALDMPLNIDKNVSLSTVFSLFPAGEADGGKWPAGTNQVAAGYVMYGACTTLVLTLGQGTDIYVLDPTTGKFHLSREGVRITETTRTFAINASNFRRWDGHIAAYIDDCLSGMEGPHGDNYNMRWSGSLVIECHRILARGGVFLYPGDRRPEYRNGKYHLLYECNPIAFLVEQAGGAASTGAGRLLETPAEELHQKAPLIFGSIREVQLIEKYYSGLNPLHERSQLFGKRGLFRT